MIRALFHFLIFLLSISSLFAQDCSGISEVFQIVESMPRFPGCEHIDGRSERISCANEKLSTFVKKNLKIPEQVKSGEIEGKGIVSFVVLPSGRICTQSVLRSLCEPCDKEMIRLVNSMPKWIPGSQRGTNVAVLFNYPVEFSKQKRRKR